MNTTAESPRVRELGIADYQDTWQSMRDFTLARDAGTRDELWVLQHNPVFTLGQAGKPEHILDARQVPVIKCDRGGQVTYHGPGQLVIYLLLDIRRRQAGVRQLVDLIEHSIIRVLAGLGISAAGKAGAPGVYVDGRKIAALGLRIKRGCSYHGLSLNVDMDLQPFGWINPCGYAGLEVTQVKNLVPDFQGDLTAAVSERLQAAILQSLL